MSKKSSFNEHAFSLQASTASSASRLAGLYGGLGCRAPRRRFQLRYWIVREVSLPSSTLLELFLHRCCTLYSVHESTVSLFFVSPEDREKGKRSALCLQSVSQYVPTSSREWTCLVRSHAALLECERVNFTVSLFRSLNHSLWENACNIPNKRACYYITRRTAPLARLLLRYVAEEESESGSYYPDVGTCDDPDAALEIQGQCVLIVDFNTCDESPAARVLPSLVGISALTLAAAATLIFVAFVDASLP